MTRHVAYGVRLRSRFALGELPAHVDDGHGDDAVDAELALDAPAAVRAAFSGPTEPRARTSARSAGTTTYRTERGRGGDCLIEVGDGSCFLIDVANRSIRCAPPEGVTDPGWRRFLLDTVLGTTALLLGFEVLHAGCVEHRGGAVAVMAGQGGGKSTLVAALLRRGHPLVADDLVALSSDGRATLAHPAPPVMNVDPDLADGLGTVLARLGDEVWLAVPNPWAADLPITALVVLDRGDHPTLAVERLPASPRPIVPFALDGGRDPQRLARRFEVLGDLAASVPIYRIAAPVSAPADDIAESLVAALDGGP